jgi:hypothetical protein
MSDIIKRGGETYYTISAATGVIAKLQLEETAVVGIPCVQGCR